MISTARASAPLPWLAAAVVLLYVVLIAMRLTMPAPKIGVEVFATPVSLQ